ncbi:MAG: catalase family protein [Pseudomonadota bacterium]
MRKRFLKSISGITLMLVAFIAYHFYSNAPVTIEEIIGPNESAQAAESVRLFKQVIDKNTTTYAARGAHAKGHACVKAWFEVDADLDKSLQHGILQQPGTTFKSWIRFSNGRSSMAGNDDTEKDAHGMAIKVLVDTDNNQVQDFLMHDHPVFFTANLADYNQFVRSENKILYFVANPNPFKWKLREMRHGLNTLKQPPTSPLATQYFSNTPYKLGPHNIKFSAKACSLDANSNTQVNNDPDFLSKTMQAELQQQAACFDFMVQLQNPKKYMPIEDASIEWKESDASYVPIAKITIPQQSFGSVEQKQFCENLSFSPWNGLAEHRPIGQLNRIRKVVYEASAKYRTKKNQTQSVQELAW